MILSDFIKQLQDIEKDHGGHLEVATLQYGGIGYGDTLDLIDGAFLVNKSDTNYTISSDVKGDKFVWV